jgi:hypothetical protein
MQNPLKTALMRGDTVTGIILFSGSPMVVELAAAAGIDFVIIDMEHSALDLDRCAPYGGRLPGSCRSVRMPEVDHGLIEAAQSGRRRLSRCHADCDNCAEIPARLCVTPRWHARRLPIVRAARYTPGDWNEYAARNREVMVILAGRHEHHRRLRSARSQRVSTYSSSGRPTCRLDWRARRHVRRAQDGRGAGSVVAVAKQHGNTS